MKITYWMNYPSHYQQCLHDELSKLTDLQVIYYNEVPAEREKLGWNSPASLPSYAGYCSVKDAELDKLLEERDRISVIPLQLGDSIVRRIIDYCTVNNRKWILVRESVPSNVRNMLKLPVYCYLSRIINKHALGVLAIGIQAYKQFLDYGVAQEKLSLFNYTLTMSDAEKDEQIAEFAGTRRIFLFMGALCGRKAIDVMLKAFSKVLMKSGSDEWCMVFVGNDTSHGEYQELSKKLGIQDSVLFRGSVSHQKINGVVKCSSVVMLPSRFDGWGVTLNEGAEAGKPLIASDRTGAAYHLIHPGFNGFIVKAGSVESLANAMLPYVNNPALIARHGENSQYLYRNYTPAHTAKVFTDVVDTWLSS